MKSNLGPMNKGSNPLPTEAKTMIKAAQGKDYGNIDEMIYVDDKVEYPSLKDIPEKKRKDLMIIKTHAVALACGDCRVLSGITREFQGPPSFPYIPCGDASGVVVEIPPEAKDSYFKVGDRVAARFAGVSRGALAEYAVISQSVCEKVPDEMTSEDAAALAGACPGVLLGERINEGDRVLILGAGGGVGSLACQIMRARGASYIAGVSRTPDRLLQPPLSYDKAVDYTKDDPFSYPEFEEKPFDVVLDLASGAWLNILETSRRGGKSIVKPASQGGRFLTITADNATYEAHSVWPVLKLFMFIPLWRAIKSRAWARSKLPKYTFAMSLPGTRDVMTKTMKYAQDGVLKAVIDPAGPFPFTTEGVRKAFRLQESRHGKGKVVVQVSSESR
jgi:NADPH:quinone reductase-like Zn-dependent oxidoreductase